MVVWYRGLRSPGSLWPIRNWTTWQKQEVSGRWTKICMYLHRFPFNCISTWLLPVRSEAYILVGARFLLWTVHARDLGYTPYENLMSDDLRLGWGMLSSCTTKTYYIIKKETQPLLPPLWKETAPWCQKSWGLLIWSHMTIHGAYLIKEHY